MQQNYSVKTFTDLDPVLIQHPGDRAVLARLEKLKPAAGLLGKVIDAQCRMSELDLIAGGLRVTADNMPDVHRIFTETCQVLGVKRIPELYLGELPIANAFSVGADKAYIYVTSELFFRLDEPEIRFLLGHELGHIICGHTKYKMLTRLLVGMGYSVPIAGKVIQTLGSVTFKPLMMLWSRRSEFSSDRSGLLACQSLEAAASFFMKIIGLPLNYYGRVDPMSIFAQADHFQQIQERSLSDNLLAGANVFNATHPQAIDRVTELKKWIDEGMYEEILDGTDETRAALAKILKADPAEAELLQSYATTLNNWAVGVLDVKRSEAAPLLRRLLYGEKITLRGTALEPILRIVAKIIPESADRVGYALQVVYVENGTAMQTELPVFVYPHQKDRSYVSPDISAEFIRNGEKPIMLEIYSV